VRPEVIDALDELERSLGDVSRWEQLLTGKEGGAAWERPGVVPAPTGEHFGPSHLVADEAAEAGDVEDTHDIDEDAAVALEAAIRNLDDRIEGIRNDAPMLQAPLLAPAPEGVPYQLGSSDHPIMQPVQASPALLQSARTVEPVSRHIPVTPEDDDEIERRRRNGRALTWVGLALLVALGGVFFLPKSDDGGDEPEAPAVTVTVPTTAPFVTAPLLPAEEITTIPTVPVEATTTTQRTTTKKRTTPTTKAPVANPGTTPTTASPPSSIVTPGPPTTTATVPEPTTTTEATTTTAVTVPVDG
jgi:hypothetical protein